MVARLTSHRSSGRIARPSVSAWFRPTTRSSEMVGLTALCPNHSVGRAALAYVYCQRVALQEHWLHQKA